MSELTPERLRELWQLAHSPSSWIDRDIPERQMFLVLLAEIDRLRASARQEAEDWAATHTAIQELCLSAGIARIDVLGDGHGVPGIGDLADMLKAEIDRLRAELRTTQAEAGKVFVVSKQLLAEQDQLRQRVADLTAGLKNLIASGMADDTAFDAAFDAAARLLTEDQK